MKFGIAQLADLKEAAGASPFDAIVDVRSPAEFAEDHMPGAINCPVLDDDERIRVGTLYKQVSPFEAKKIGAALIARNIARHIETQFLDMPRHWKPLIYCWRGGLRSGAMVTLFRSIGWNACQLEGGYKTYRQNVVAELATLPDRFAFRVICGATGSGKSRILQAIGAQGGQIVDLEALACHKGSVLGVLPGQPQPSQKMFETQLLLALQALDPARPVYVEAESRKIGRLHVPEAMIARMRAGACLVVEADPAARVAFLLRDYDYFLADPEWLKSRLGALRELRGAAVVERWQGLADSGDWPTLVGELLAQHYDPLYKASQSRNYQDFGTPAVFRCDDLSEPGIASVARAILAAQTR